MAGVSVLLGVGLLWLAVPRSLAALSAMDGYSPLQDLNRGKPLKTEDVIAGIESFKRGVGWLPSSGRLISLATLELQLAWSLPAGDPRRLEVARDAESHFVEGLTRNPADGYAWLNLAITRHLLGQSGRAVTVCLLQSIDMAPNTRPLWLIRARLLLHYWPSMTVEEVNIFRRQLRTIWNTDQAMRRPLVDMARQLGQLGTLAWTLEGDREATGQFRELTR